MRGGVAEEDALIRERRRVGVRWLIVVTCLVVLVDIGAGVLTLTSAHKTDSARNAVTAGLNYVENSSSLMQAVLDAETGQRGYLLTGEKSYLNPALAAVKRGGPLLKEVKTGSLNDPILRADYAKLVKLIDARLDDLVITVKLYEEGKHAQALAVVKTNRGNTLTQQLRVLTAAMITRSDMLVNQARARSRSGQSLASSAAIAAYAASGLLLLMMAVLIRRYLFVEQRRRASELAQMEAERLSAAKTGFLSRVSHELRTPLNAILGFGQLLEREPLDTSQRETLDQMLTGGRHLLVIVDDLLDLSRLEVGELRLSIEPVQLVDAVREARAMISGAAAAAAVGVRVRPMDQGLYVRADRQRLMQVLLNLVSNAVKYNRRGGNVVIGAEQTADGRVRVEVVDTGIGIPAEEIPQLFTPFERLDAASRGIEGTGLGLAVARGLIEAMDGSLDLSSVRGEGTTVWFELTPSSEEEVAAQSDPDRSKFEYPANVAAQAEPGTTEINGNGKRHRAPGATVLYIEDNPSNVRLVEKIFALRPDMTLSIARDGASGLALIRELHPSVVLLDLHLPDIPGEQVLSALLNDPEINKIPVIIVSADASPMQAKRLRAAGAAGYLTKPFEVDKLLEAVRVGGTPQILSDGSDAQPGLLDPSVVASLHMLADNRAVGPAQVGEMISAFMRDSEGMMAALHEGFAAGDLEKVAREAHRLAGGSGTFGAGSFRNACREIEARARAGRADKLGELEAGIDELLELTWEALQEEFKDELSAVAAPPAADGAPEADARTS